MADRLGQQFGNYRLVALLGQGGYAEVYLGQHVRFNQQAAIKIVHAHLSGQEVEHFQQEAETIATLAHPSIVRVFDFDVQNGVPFLVMDYAPNGSLRQRYPKGKLVPLPQIVSSVKLVAAALQYAHDKKFIHRDVKPENMLIGQHQEVLLSDFGIATIAHNTSSFNASAQGTSGTLAYMAPEQIEGHPRPASDQYALAVVIYEWLCGERPFEGSVSEVMAQHLSMPPPPLRERMPEIPPEVEQVVLRALAKDPKARFASVEDFAAALEQASQRALAPTAQLASEQVALGPAASSDHETVAVVPNQPVLAKETTPSADLPVGDLEPTVYPGFSAPNGLDTPQSGDAVVPALLEPAMAVQRKARRLTGLTAALLIGLTLLVIAGGVLGSTSLLTHFGVLGTRRSATTPVVRGGTWTDDFAYEPESLIPNGGGKQPATLVDQALYLPLLYSDAQGVVHPGAANEVPTVQNGDISADATTWTFHLRPHLVWSDGAPYDARDVDFTWQLWRNPKFGAANTLNPYALGLNLISRAEVSADNLSIAFHLKQAFAPFLSLWVDGIFAPLPVHHFSTIAPEQILKSSENLNPQVVSGPFMMSESVPGDHYTLVRNPRYYRARDGLPYLDKVVFRIVDNDTILKDLRAGTITSVEDMTANLDLGLVQVYQRLPHYTLVTPATSNSFEVVTFNFHNTVLASHLEVRQAMAMMIDHRALIDAARHGRASSSCIDHGSALHPGYEPNFPCPEFDPAAANKLLDDKGWVKGSDGVRDRDGQRLEFEYSTTATSPARLAVETILQRNFKEIGIQLDIQNYPGNIFFGPFLTGGKASPPTGAVAGRYDIAELSIGLGFDPDDSSLLSCDQIPPQGYNIDFYCNPALDALYQQELATADAGVRQKVFRQIHVIYLTEFPFIVLYSQPDPLTIVRKGMHNFLPSPFVGHTVNIWEWWCDKGKC